MFVYPPGLDNSTITDRLAKSSAFFWWMRFGGGERALQTAQRFSVVKYRIVINIECWKFYSTDVFRKAMVGTGWSVRKRVGMGMIAKHVQNSWTDIIRHSDSTLDISNVDASLTRRLGELCVCLRTQLIDKRNQQSTAVECCVNLLFPRKPLKTSAGEKHKPI